MGRAMRAETSTGTIGHAMIVTIDGPAGAGKSTVARSVAERLDFHFLDTGAMYRAVALMALRRGIAWHDTEALVRLATGLNLEITDHQIFADGQEVTDEIRRSEVANVIHYVADCPGVRACLVELQRAVASRGNYVTEGRDQGTVAFPDADCKIFLTGSPEERAKRRMRELTVRGEAVSFDEILEQQNERDRRDRERPVGALRKAADAIEISTDGLELAQVIQRVEREIRHHLRLDWPQQAIERVR